MKQEKCCSNCQRGTSMHLTKDILCKYRGIVTPDYICFKYKSSADLPQVQQPSYKCAHCEYFLVELDSENQNLGKCKLFSARDFDGNTRNACSKFSRKMFIEEVS
ncbi:hypothetical protein CLHUN_30770 [Ruminiclostridium hungatei]|uniref:Uncharacterized protein n=1 Tax=Ruminiclostridium hungatei TaxID=48256 RepID=A0A1V4SGS1_RUMHU|nr:hypothetical protein [Ruminiclostridium hungatei]OPX42933.1 hypothetical protein CLHUN_30770 [Ruminiclostridium hungatei]